MYEKDKRSWLKHLDFILLDLIAVAASFAAAYVIRMREYHFANTSSYRSVYIIVLVFHVLIVVFFRSYSDIIRRSYLEEGRGAGVRSWGAFW